MLNDGITFIINSIDAQPFACNTSPKISQFYIITMILQDGNTPLMLACMNGYFNVAELSLEQGADMTVITKVRIHSKLVIFMKQRYINALV